MERKISLITGASESDIQLEKRDHGIRLISKLRAMLENRVPFGYQDETGFHYGVQR